MDLFLVATSCQDPEIGRFFLDGAGQDVNRAVNHYFNALDASSCTQDPASVAKAAPSMLSTRTPKTHVGRSVLHPDQERERFFSLGVMDSGVKRVHQDAGEVVVWDCVDKDGTSPKDRLRKRAKLTEGKSSSNSFHFEEKMKHPCPDREEKSLVPVWDPSQMWVETSMQCQRDGINFVDKDFLAMPQSLDGRKASLDQGNGRDSKGFVDNGGRGDGSGTFKRREVHCQCGMPSRVMTVRKAGPNQGKLFYGCTSSSCKSFFISWAVDVPHTGQALSLLWRRFSPPRFRLVGSSGFKSEDILQVDDMLGLSPNQVLFSPFF